MSIYKKLLEIQKRINGLGKDKDTKSQYNPNGYAYVTGSKVLGNIKPLMNELGLILKQEVLSIENVRQDYLTAKGHQKVEILSKLQMKFTWVDVETGEKDENLFGANGQNDWDKGVGSALTYAERYFLLKYFHIPTDEDDIDNPDSKSTPTDEDDKPITIAKAKTLIKNAQTIEQLTAIFNRNQHLHADKDFTDTLTKRKTELKPKQ